MSELTKNQRSYLRRRECMWCGQTLDKESCGAIYERCSEEVRRDRRERCLAQYKPRKPRPTPEAKENTNV